MASLRTQFVETVTVPMGVGGDLIPVSGIGTTIFNVNADGTEGSQANAYADRTSNIPAASLATDANGTVSYYLDPGDYNIHFDDQQSPPRIPSFIRAFSSVPAFQATEISLLQNSINTLNANLTALQNVVSALDIPIGKAMNVLASETVTSTAFTTMPTPDEVSITLAANAILVVLYQAAWSETVAGASTAGLFMASAGTAHQVQYASDVQSGIGVEHPQLVGVSATKQSGDVANNFTPLFSKTTGLGSAPNSTPVTWPGDATTGQVVGGWENGEQGGPCFIFADPGTYTVSIQFMITSGSVTARDRKLRVLALPYS